MKIPLLSLVWYSSVRGVEMDIYPKIVRFVLLSLVMYLLSDVFCDDSLYLVNSVIFI